MALHTDTIFALSSGRGRAGVAVVRVSGQQAGAALLALVGPDLPKPRADAHRSGQRTGDIGTAARLGR